MCSTLDWIGLPSFFSKRTFDGEELAFLHEKLHDKYLSITGGHKCPERKKFFDEEYDAVDKLFGSKVKNSVLKRRDKTRIHKSHAKNRQHNVKSLFATRRLPKFVILCTDSFVGQIMTH